jgi:DNA topoisomerase I
VGYTLVICEKPDAARRVADALSEGKSRTTVVEGTSVHSFSWKGEDFVVCAAQGHIYGVSDPSAERTVFPVFDIEWYPSNLLDEESESAARRVSAITKLAGEATRFVNACDYDVEGETIGFNILRYACGGKEVGALRARFSTLTSEDLKKAFDELEAHPQSGFALAGRARHSIDFVWGVNLSRALSQSALASGHRFRTVSMGRVQGPTLGFLVQREREIREFVPTPYWKVSGVFEIEGKKIAAGFSEAKVKTEMLAKKIRDGCAGKEATAVAVRKNVFQIGPPVPFDIGELQREAYRAFGFSPRRTLQIAEGLYLKALISYPRTGSQKLPPSLNLRGIVSGVGKIREYSALASEILESGVRPAQGSKSDPAHPAIHPTGQNPQRPLDHSESSVFDLVVRRFLAVFGPPARRESVDVTLAVGEHRFTLSGGRTIFPGWTSYYGRYAGLRDHELPRVAEGEAYHVSEVLVEEKFEPKPSRYNPGSLLGKMEAEGIGTKATRADIIATLIGRGYVAGEGMEVSELGFAVVEVMEKFAPSILSTKFTHEIEERLESVEGGSEREATILRDTVRSLAEQSAALGAEEDLVGKEIDAALVAVTARTFVLGRCPVCKTGELRLIRSKKTGKRFAGCSNYPSVCQASGPLPQKGAVKATGRTCEHCSWPIVYVTGKGKPWKLCVNAACPGKKK